MTDLPGVKMEGSHFHLIWASLNCSTGTIPHWTQDLPLGRQLSYAHRKFGLHYYSPLFSLFSRQIAYVFRTQAKYASHLRLSHNYRIMDLYL